LKRFLVVIFVVLMTLTLVGCSMSENEALKSTEKTVEEAFYESGNEPTENTDSFSYYLPTTLSIEDEMDNNVILKDGNEPIILFYNLNEDLSSQVLYAASIEKNNGKAILSKTFEDNGRFGYLIVTTINDRLYEMVVGIGGVKLTTEVNPNDMVNRGEAMMELARSAQY
jgi:hypothetical protein